MPINRAPFNALIDDDGSNTVGSVWNKTAIATTLLDPIDQIGTWVAVPFNAGNFAGGGSMVFTVAVGQVAVNRYTVIGKTMHWSVWLKGSTLSGTPHNTLFFKVPGGYQSTDGWGLAATAQLYDGTTRMGWVKPEASGGYIIVQIQGEPNFALVPLALYCAFTVTFEIK